MGEVVQGVRGRRIDSALYLGEVERLDKYARWNALPGLMVQVLGVIKSHGDGLEFDLVSAYEEVKVLGLTRSFYVFLYDYTVVDFIGWQVRNGCFDWEECSDVLVCCARRYFDKDKFNWRDGSDYIFLFNAIELFDKDRFNWETGSYHVLLRAKHLFDPEKFNWKRFSGLLLEVAPELFDAERFNWKDFSRELLIHAPQYFDPDRFNWEDCSDDVLVYAPERFDPIRFNWKKSKLMKGFGGGGLPNCRWGIDKGRGGGF